MTIGYILLIPSLAGMALAVVLWLVSLVGTSGTTSFPSEATLKKLREAEVPESVVERLRDGDLSDSEKLELTPEQAAVVNEVIREREIQAAAVGMVAGCGTVFFGALFVGSFVGGLVGWLLIMKKTVLRCASCGAEVAAG